MTGVRLLAFGDNDTLKRMTPLLPRSMRNGLKGRAATCAMWRAGLVCVLLAAALGHSAATWPGGLPSPSTEDAPSDSTNSPVDDALAAFDEWAYVMDLTQAHDRELFGALPKQLAAALEHAQMPRPPPASLVRAAVRSIQRLRAHVTKDALASGRVDTVYASDRVSLVPWALTLLRLLLDAGADVNSADEGGVTAVHLAALFGEHEALALLLRAGGTFGDDAMAQNAASLWGQTPLHVACTTGDLQSIRILRSHCAPFDARDDFGRTCVDIAANSVHARADALTALLDESDRLRCDTCPRDPVWQSSTACTASVRVPSAPYVDAESELHPQCPFARVDVRAMTRETFVRDHLSVRVPLLVTGATDEWHVRRTWSLKDIADRHGALVVRVGGIPYGAVFGAPHGKSTLASYLRAVRLPDGGPRDWPPRRVPPYVFDADVLAHDSDFFAAMDNPLPPWLVAPLSSEGLRAGVDAPTVVRQFFLGPAGSGAPFHFHCEATNALVHGRKRWLLTPPASSFYSKMHPIEWGLRAWNRTDVEALLDLGKSPSRVPREMSVTGRPSPVFSCDQAAGELLFVPSFWGHLTVNLEESVGLAFEFDRGDC